jgi:glutamyl-Q tRNA(Asp) synthetase
MSGLPRRFAPSPTGPLHAGSLVAALASWLDARAHGGAWLVRIEDVDRPRCVPGADAEILRQLAACGLLPDEPPHGSRSATRCTRPRWTGCWRRQAYPCACSRKDIEVTLRALGRERPAPWRAGVSRHLPRGPAGQGRARLALPRA